MFCHGKYAVIFSIFFIYKSYILYFYYKRDINEEIHYINNFFTNFDKNLLKIIKYFNYLPKLKCKPLIDGL